MKCGKTIETAHRALEILKELMYKKMSVDEILYSLISDENYSIVYAKETIYKYFNTFRCIGMEIEKDKSSYIISKSFAQIPFSPEDKFILNLIQNYIKATCQKSANEKYENIKLLLHKNNIDTGSNLVPLDYDNIIRISQRYEKYKDYIIKLENACVLQQQLKIKYEYQDKNIIEYKVFANKLVFEKGIVTFHAFCIATNEMISFMVERIKDIDFLPQKSTGNYYYKTAVFNILNEFSKNYRLKEGEYIKEKKEGCVQIVSKYQNSETLLKRLFRYGNNCEIISPLSLREAMKQKIEKTYNLYKIEL